MAVDWFPLWLSLRVAFFATAISLVPALWLAWLLAGREFRGKQVLASAVELPLVLPSTVFGWYLLVALGQGTLLGRFYESITGAPLLFTWQAAVVAGAIYSAPLLVKSARAALEALDATSYARAARGLGASEWRVFWRVTLPLARGPILGATALAFARSMADFGITIMIAGNFPGRTQTLSVAVFDAVGRGNGATARTLVLVISLAALALLYAANRLQTRQAAR